MRTASQACLVVPWVEGREGLGSLPPHFWNPQLQFPSTPQGKASRGCLFSAQNPAPRPQACQAADWRTRCCSAHLWPHHSWRRASYRGGLASALLVTKSPFSVQPVQPLALPQELLSPRLPLPFVPRLLPSCSAVRVPGTGCQWPFAQKVKWSHECSVPA